LGGIIAIGNLTNLNKRQYREFINQGVQILDNHNKQENSADVLIMTEIFKKTQLYAPPYTIMLLSGDSDFAEAISFLSKINYDCVLVSNGHQLHRKFRWVKEWYSWERFLFNKFSIVGGKSDEFDALLYSDSSIDQIFDKLLDINHLVIKKEITFEWKIPNKDFQVYGSWDDYQTPIKVLNTKNLSGMFCYLYVIDGDIQYDDTQPWGYIGSLPINYLLL
jgi:hypothetical protein